MGGKYTEAQKNATKEYMKNKKTIRVIVTEDRHKKIQEYSDSIGESMSAFINRAIDETMKNDKEKGLK